MPSDYWNRRNEVFARTFQIMTGIAVDGLAGEETFTELDPRNWPMRDLPDGRHFFVTNPFVPGVHDGVDLFVLWIDGDQLIFGYFTPFAGGRVWVPFGAVAPAACAGKVLRSELISTGWFVVLEHVNGDTTGYFHGVEGTAMVEVGDSVERGQSLFFCGHDLSAPLSEENPVHLHFTVVRNGVYMDPEAWLAYADYLNALHCE